MTLSVCTMSKLSQIVCGHLVILIAIGVHVHSFMQSWTYQTHLIFIFQKTFFLRVDFHCPLYLLAHAANAYKKCWCF